MTETQTAPFGGFFLRLPYIKLALVLLAALLMPWWGLWTDTYAKGPGLISGKYTHTLYVYGMTAYNLCGIVGQSGLIFGLIWPRLSLWVGEANRARVMVIYGSILLVAWPVEWETEALDAKLKSREMSEVATLYERLQTGQNTKQTEATTLAVSPNLRIYGDSNSDRLAGFPVVEAPGSMLQIGHIDERHDSYVLVEMRDPRGEGKPVITRVLQVRNRKIITSKPAMTDADPQFFRGTIVQGPNALTFFPCQDMLPASIGKIASKANETIAHNLNAGGRGLFVLAEGVVHPDPECPTCASEKRTMEIFSIRETHMAEPGVCDRGY